MAGADWLPFAALLFHAPGKIFSQGQQSTFDTAARLRTVLRHQQQQHSEDTVVAREVYQFTCALYGLLAIPPGLLDQTYIFWNYSSCLRVLLQI